MLFLKKNEYEYALFGRTTLVVASLFFDLISTEDSLDLLPSIEKEKRYFNATNIYFNTLGDEFIYSHKNIMRTIGEAHTSLHSPSLSDILMTEGSLATESYLFMTLLVAKLIKENGRDVFLIKRFRDLCSIYLTALIFYVPDEPLKSLDFRRKFFEKIPLNKRVTTYAGLKSSLAGKESHAMLASVTPREIGDDGQVERRYGIRIYNTGDGSEFHAVKSGYEGGNQQIRASYQDYDLVDSDELEYLHYFANSAATATDQRDAIDSLYKTMEQYRSEKEVPFEFYDKIQQSGTCVSSVVSAFLRSFGLKGRLLEMDIKHATMHQLQSRMNDFDVI